MMTRAYHNLTSHYNIYFNGYQSFERGINKVEEGFQDNYSKLLPVFYYSEPSTAQTVAPDMDRALEKATKVITLHSITVKPDIKRGIQTEKQKAFYNKKEYNKWIDENYILMAKAYIYKNEFRTAIETLRKMINDFPKEETRFEGMIWMARAYNEIEEYREAENLLNALDSNEELPKEYRADLYTTYADFYIKRDEYQKAIPYLEKALEFIRDKHYKIRYTYLLAQLYQQVGNSEETIANYRRVIRMNPPYEMTFNAKINMAGSFEAGSGQAREIRSLLAKMLRDDKNIEFQDQIYYALGNIALKEKKIEKAVENYELSASTSVSNYNQKGLSYVALGDIYYEMPEYSLSQAYYDSSLQNIDQDYDKYEELTRKAKSLTNLVQHSTVYDLQDSLQTLASLPEEELYSRIDRIIEQVIKEEEEKREREREEMLDRQYGMAMGNTSSRSQANSQGGKWYFYNMNAKSFGQPEFRMKWGNRKLEDHWRRKNKQSLDVIEQTEEGELADSASEDSKKVLSNKNREFYLKDIPLTDSAMEVSDEKLKVALYNMGLVYRNELRDIQEAIEAFTGVVERYPDDEYALLSAYNLYEIYDLENNSSRSEYYKNWIIQNFPDSPRAKILSDPEYVQQLLEEQSRADLFYRQTYEKFNQRDDQSVIKNVEFAKQEFSDHKLLPKFDLLGAISRGRLGGKDVMTSELETIIEKYPNTEESDYASAMIKHLYESTPELEIADTQEKAAEIYSPDSTGIFFFGIATEKAVDMNQLKFNLIDFNLDNFDRLELNIEEEQINNQQFVFVKAFEDLEMAERYFVTYQNSSEQVFRDVDPEKVTVFYISRFNYVNLKEDKDVRKYKLFFDKTYQPQ
jgi:tetratricopeptide (TPR) repeat protein